MWMDSLTRYDNIPTVVLLATVAVVGTLANLTILYVYLTKFPRTAFNFLVVVLASVDLFSCFLLMPLDAITLARPDLLQPSTLCGILGFGVCTLGVTSGLVLAAIAYIRYRLVCHPHADAISLFQVKCFSAASFFLGLIFGWPPMFVTKTTSIILDSTTVLLDCGIDKNLQQTGYPMAFYVSLCMVFNVIMVALSAWYTKLARILWSRRKIFVVQVTDRSTGGPTSSDRNAIIIHIKGGDDSTSSSQQAHQENIREVSRHKESSRAVLMMSIVTLVFFTSYLPHFALVFFGAILRLFSYDGMTSYSFVYRFIYANNFANFVIYSVVSGAFKKQLKSLTTKILKCSR